MGEAHPVFSIIIPTYNRFKELALCLQSLTRLNYPLDYFEVIAVDDGGLHRRRLSLIASGKKLT